MQILLYIILLKGQPIWDEMTFFSYFWKASICGSSFLAMQGSCRPAVSKILMEIQMEHAFKWKVRHRISRSKKTATKKKVIFL